MSGCSTAVSDTGAAEGNAISHQPRESSRHTPPSPSQASGSEIGSEGSGWAASSMAASMAAASTASSGIGTAGSTGSAAPD